MAHLLSGMDISGIAGAVASAFLYSLLARPYFSQLAHKQQIKEEAHEP